jgi:hypothetical protein
MTQLVLRNWSNISTFFILIPVLFFSAQELLANCLRSVILQFLLSTYYVQDTDLERQLLLWAELCPLQIYTWKP